MLHILNGQSTLDLLKQTSIKGTFLVWKDMLMEGPVKESSKGIDWSKRATYLKDRFGINAKTYLASMNKFFATLEKAAKEKTPVTLWFEEDFFCQIHLIYLLAHLPAPLLQKGRVFIICPEKPLGIRLPSSMERLFNSKIPLEPSRLILASKVWKAYSLASMAGWESLLKWAQGGKGFSTWPLLQKGLRCYLGLRPAPDGGPNPIEAAMLRALTGGPISFPQFFRRTWVESQVRPLGLGDLQIARYALDFSMQGLPLIKIEGAGSAPVAGKPIDTKDWKLSLTAEGKALFAPMSMSERTKPKSKAKSKPKTKPAAKKK
jgi:hypothetical protein